MTHSINIRNFSQLKTLTTLMVLFSGTLRAGVSPECKRYDSNSEYYKVCASYAPEKVKVAKPGIDLNQSVSEIQDGDLLLLQGGSYQINEPVKLIKGKGLIPASQNVFIELVPSEGFDTPGEMVSSLVLLGNKSALSGLKVEGKKLAGNQHFSHNNGKKKVLVHGSGTHGFRLSWSDLTGTDGLHALVLSDFDNGGDIEKNTYYQIHKNWLETNGSAYGVSIKVRSQPSAEGVQEHVDIQDNAIILNGGEAEGSPDQCAVSVTNGDGKVHNNYVVYRGQNPPSDQKRSGLSLTQVAGTVVEGNSFISEMPKKRDRDFHFYLHEYQPVAGVLKAKLLSNAMDSKATPMDAQVGGSGIETRDLYESNRIPYFQTREQFFASGGMAGVCLANRYLLDNIRQTQHKLPVNSSLSQQVCGTETRLTFLEPFEGCPNVETLVVIEGSHKTEALTMTILFIAAVIVIAIQSCISSKARSAVSSMSIRMKDFASGNHYSSIP